MVEELPRTLRHYYTDMRKARGGGLEDRYEWLLGIVFDGRTFGEYPTDFEVSAERLKRHLEVQGLGWTLAGCDADLSIASIDFVAPPAADCAVLLRDGFKVNMEVARVAVEAELQYQDTLKRIIATADDGLRAICDPEQIPGEYFFRFYGSDRPSPKQVRDIANELAEFVLKEVSQNRPSASYRRAGNAYPTLASLGAHVARADAPSVSV